MKVLRYTRVFFILIVSIGFSGGCASSQFFARSDGGAVVMPDGKTASLSKNGMAVSAVKINTPNGLNDKITTFRVTLINQTGDPIEFIPKEYLLFDQSNRQFLALTKPDLSEAVVGGKRLHGSMSWGFGFGTFGSRSMTALHYSSNPYWAYDPFYPRRSYQALLAKALPIHPITVFPHAMVDGNIYFAVSPSELREARLQITRLSEMPEPGKNVESIMYVINYQVVRG